jgi:integrase/recombinase XerD
VTPPIDYITQWASDAKTRGMDPKTIITHNRSLKRIEKYLAENSISLKKAEKTAIRSYIEDCRSRGLTTRTIKNYLAALSSFYEFLLFEGLRKDNPVGDMRKRYLTPFKADSECHTHKLISVEDAARLVGSMVDIRDKAMLLLLFKTGVRRGELMSMEVKDINWQNQGITLKPKKKRSNRIVFFDDETGYYLRRWLEVRASRSPRSDALWVATWGSKIDHGSLVYVIEKAALLCGLHDPTSPRMEDHFSAHCCRHWFTTHLRRAGMPREFIQELRGDVRKEAIDIYDHIDKEELRKSYLAHIPQLGV